MPVKRGHVAPQNTFIDTIIRKFDAQKRKFVIANARCENKPIIYVNDAFCNLFKYQRPEIMQKACTCQFLYGAMTSNASREQINNALLNDEETQIIIWLYKSDGSNFLCKLLLAPVKNENLDVILFILNFDELNEQINDNSRSFSKRNRLLQQIGIPFISSIFARTPSPIKTPPDQQINDPFSFLDKSRSSRSDHSEMLTFNIRKSKSSMSVRLFQGNKLLLHNVPP